MTIINRYIKHIKIAETKFRLLFRYFVHYLDVKRVKIKFLFFCWFLIIASGCFNSSFYKPNHTLYERPDQYNLPYEEVFFKSKDGTMLYGWFVPAAGEAVGTVIHFNGNFGNLTYYFKQIHWLPLQNFNIFTFDYRMYCRI